MKLSFSLDTDSIEAGEWCDFGELQGGLEVQLRGVRSRAFRRAHERQLAPLRGLKLKGPSRLRAFDRAFRIALAEGAIVDWRGMKDVETGDLIPYSKALARELMGVGPALKPTEEDPYPIDSQYDLFSERAVECTGKVGLPPEQVDPADEDEEEAAAEEKDEETVAGN